MRRLYPSLAVLAIVGFMVAMRAWAQPAGIATGATGGGGLLLPIINTGGVVGIAGICAWVGREAVAWFKKRNTALDAFTEITIPEQTRRLDEQGIRLEVLTSAQTDLRDSGKRRDQQWDDMREAMRKTSELENTRELRREKLELHVETVEANIKTLGAAVDAVAKHVHGIAREMQVPGTSPFHDPSAIAPMRTRDPTRLDHQFVRAAVVSDDPDMPRKLGLASRITDQNDKGKR